MLRRQVEARREHLVLERVAVGDRHRDRRRQRRVAGRVAGAGREGVRAVGDQRGCPSWPRRGQSCPRARRSSVDVELHTGHADVVGGVGRDGAAADTTCVVRGRRGYVTLGPVGSAAGSASGVFMSRTSAGLSARL